MSRYQDVNAVKSIGIVGTGTIGASWAAYFLAQGFKVKAWDPANTWKVKLENFIESAWTDLEKLGVSEMATPSNLTLCDELGSVTEGVDFIQENAPEHLGVKQKLFRELDKTAPTSVIISSSTSGLIMSEMQVNIENAERFVVGHPFNPPHLIPLVEVVGGELTAVEVVEWTIDFYNLIGKHAIKINKEVPGHLANRLQAALWREAVLAVQNDLASVEDVNAAVAQGPGLRWALMGPHMIMNLAGGKGGLEQMLSHFAPGIQGWWQTMMETPNMNQKLQETLVDGVNKEAGNKTIDDLEKERDTRLIKILRMLRETK